MNAKRIKLGIKQVIKETPDTITIEFERPAEVEFIAGQFLTLINEVNGKEERRSYSLCSAPHEMDKLAVSVKRVDGGLISNYLNDHAASMASMDVLTPIGAFYLAPDPNIRRHYVLFAGGSGITPMFSIMKSILEEEKGSVVTLINQNRNSESIIYKKQIEAFQQEFPIRLKVIHYLTQPEAGWSGNSGRLSTNEIEKLIKNLPGDLQRIFYMCGPNGYMETVLQALDHLSVPKENIHRESFGGAHPKSDQKEMVADENSAKAGHEVTIIFDGKEYKYHVAPGDTILDAGLDQDIDLPYSCQSGVCTACRGKCLSGKVDLSEVEGLSEKELNDGYVLTCVGTPLSDDVVIEIG